MERKFCSLAVIIEFASVFEGKWLLTICDGKIERMERWCDANFRDLERTLVLKERNSIAIHDVDVHLGIDHCKLEVSTIRRGIRFETVHVMSYDNVWRTIDGKRRAVKRYKVEKSVEPFTKAADTLELGDDEEI